MYLSCPRCQTVYAVRAAMLREGQGEVRCGACDAVFNALDYLSDALPRAGSADAVPENGPGAGAAAEAAAASRLAAEQRAAMPRGGGARSSDDAPALHPADSPGEAPTAGAHGGPVAATAGDAVSGELRGDADAARRVDGVPGALREDVPGALREDVPGALREDVPGALRDNVPGALRDDAERFGRQLNGADGVWARAGLGAAAALLLAALGAQYLWFQPEDLSARFPQARPLVERFCVAAGCLLPRRRDPSRMRMLSRDVRAHPEYEGALLVTATFSNSAPWPQPFPRLRFTLYDVNGQTIAARTFSPLEYLGGVLPPDSALPPGQPVQVALEMLAPEEAAVSFEFTFL